MFSNLFSKEIRQHLLTFRFAAALLTTIILVLVSVWILSEDFLRRRSAFNLLAERSDLENREVYIPTQINPTLHRPPSPLSIFAQGEDRRFGNSLRIHRWEMPRGAEGGLTDNEMLAGEPILDLLTVFTLVISLFGILLSYDQISGEREAGTLKLICSGSAGRGAVYTAKFSAALTCLAIPFLLSLVGGLLVIVFVFNISFTAAQWIAVVLMASSALLYGAFFIAVGMACSAALRWSAAALVLSLVVWALGVLLIPIAAQSVANAVVPLSSPAEITDLKIKTQREIDAKLEKEFTPKYPEAGSGSTGGWPDKYWLFDGNKANFNDTVEFVRFYEPLMMNRAQQVWEAFRGQVERKERQASWADILSSPSPAHQLGRLFTELAGTGVSSYRKFLNEARRYRREMVAEFQRRGYFGEYAWNFMSRRAKSDVTDDLYERRSGERERLRAQGVPWEKLAGPRLWGLLPESDIPTFNYSGVEPDFTGATGPLAFLAIADLVLFVLGFFAFVRYDVR
jgi:ABC-type transport system involved in multi-copper enzyme maturation permease subunit